MNLVLEKFPLLCAAARNPSRFEVAVEWRSLRADWLSRKS